MAQIREKFATQVSSKTIRRLARKEGRQLQALASGDGAAMGERIGGALEGRLFYFR